jgi:hypothetical protein
MRMRSHRVAQPGQDATAVVRTGVRTVMMIMTVAMLVTVTVIRAMAVLVLMAVILLMAVLVPVAVLLPKAVTLLMAVLVSIAVLVIIARPAQDVHEIQDARVNALPHIDNYQGRARAHGSRPTAAPGWRVCLVRTVV